jgi:hypothetical protein
MDCNSALARTPDLDAIRQEHESFLSELEALAIQAIASGDWSRVRDLINDFKDYRDENAGLEPERACEELAELFSQANQIINQPHYQVPVSADELDTPSADSSPTTFNRKDFSHHDTTNYHISQNAGVLRERPQTR